MLRSNYRSDPNHEMRPMMLGRLIAAGGYGPLMEVLIDSGSTVSLFPLGLLPDLGLKESALTWVNGAGRPAEVRWHGQSYPRGSAEVGIQLRDDAGQELTWLGSVSFSNAPLPYAILGQRGGLALLRVILDGSAQTVELAAGGTLPALPWSKP